ncbi:AraC family transcriptional regulator [Moheibacter sediminis]|uniref:AraC-type DNA-binding protein n=1 Tax=Moheibacter sediminis TaxID=1434700 RepID=A0A1W2BE37_9FLAO|nr:AraC family transcriptional regulator [Moheibacter sediminis]SMC70648.1 AraC-type DNA-binding protein [Moheibacter sediminis]
MTKFLCISILFLCSQSIYAQQSKFDSVYNLVSSETIKMKWAVNVADSLYKISATEEQKVRASMLSANLLQKTGMINEALVYAKRADSIAEKSQLHDLQARVCGLISTIYRVAKLPIQGKVYLEKAMKASQKIVDINNSSKFQGNLHQEMAYYAMDDLKYREAISILKKGKSSFEKVKITKERNFLLATNEELIAKNYVSLREYEQALAAYEKSISFLDKSGNESALEGFIYNGMGNIHLARNDNESAIKYYNLALEIAEASQFLALKEEVYQALINYYKITKDQENYVRFNEKYLKLRDEFEQAKTLSANYVVKELHSREKSAAFNFYTIIGISVLLIVFAFGSYLYIRKKRRKDILHFNQTIQELKQRHKKTKEQTVSKSEQKSFEREFVPIETEQKIMDKLNGFEDSVKYLEKGYSLSMLAVELETNTKYLSHVINKNKQTDFNNYINRLKINYIVGKLHDEPIYSNYKISYLADECGFSSHSKFTTIFKNVTGVSPTTFLSHLAENKSSKN